MPGAQFPFVRFINIFVQKHWDIHVVNSSFIVNVCEVQLIFSIARVTYPVYCQVKYCIDHSDTLITRAFEICN